MNKRIEKKKYIFEFYKRNLSGLDGLEFMPVNEWNEPNFWLTCILLKGKVRPLDIIEALEVENIESRPIWKPMHMQPFFAKYDFIGEGVWRKYLKMVCACLLIPRSDEDLNRVCDVIKGCGDRDGDGNDYGKKEGIKSQNNFPL